MRPAVIETNLERLTENYRLIRAHADNRPVMAVVKANAYGHGLVRVAQHYESLGVEWLAVALLEEGVTLRKAGVRQPILVFGGHHPTQIPEFLRWDLDNENGLPVASGMYFVHIDMPDINKTRILKLAVVGEQQFLENF